MDLKQLFFLSLSLPLRGCQALIGHLDTVSGCNCANSLGKCKAVLLH